MKRVYSSFNLQLVHHKKNLLEAEGVRVSVRNEILSSGMGELPPTETELWVENQDLEKANLILSRGVTGPDWTCRCGETLGPQFTHCWSCGSARTPAPA